MQTKSDTTLVLAVLGGDKTAYAQLYDRYARLVRAVCFDTTRNLNEAQDLAQDVFLRAYENLADLRDAGKFAPWLIGIAKMRCRDWLRQHLKLRKRYAPLDPEQSADCEMSNDGEIEQLRTAITQLPDKERLALHTFYLQEQPVEDACRNLNLSRSGLYRVLDRARRRLGILMRKKQEDIR